MNRRNGIFIITCILVGGICMLVSMISGEFIVRRDLFGDLAHNPAHWPGIFLNSAAWLIPTCVLGFSLIAFAQQRMKGSVAQQAAFVWCSFGILLTAVYKVRYFPPDWKSPSRFPEVLFGWLIPAATLIILFTLLSMWHFRLRHDQNAHSFGDRIF